MITVTFPDGRVETHLIDTVSLDLGTGAAELATRSVYVPATLEAMAPMPSCNAAASTRRRQLEQLAGARRA